MPWWEALIRSAAALGLIAFAALASWRSAWLLIGARDTLLRWTGMMVIGLAASTLGFFALHFTHLFRIEVAVPATIGLWWLVRRLTRHAPSDAEFWRRERRVLGALGRSWQRSPSKHLGFPFLVMMGLMGARCLLLPPLGWDTMVYHGPRAAIWVQQAGFTLPENAPSVWSHYRKFPAGSEVSYAWAMLPFHGDTLYGLCSFLQWLGLGVAVWALARRLGLREPRASVAAIAVMFIPTLQLEVGTGYVELLLMLAGCAALSCSVAFYQNGILSLAVLALIAAGLSFGVKLPGVFFAVPTVGLIALGLWRHRRRMSPRAGLSLLLGAAVAALPPLPWLIYNVIDSGLPLSPFPIRVAGIQLGEMDRCLRDMIGWIPQAWIYDWDREWTALKGLFPPPSSRSEALGVTMLIPLVFAVLAVGKCQRRRWLPVFAMWSLILLLIANHFSRSSAALRFIWPASVARFLLPFVAGSIVLSMLISTKRHGFYLWLLLAITGINSTLRLFVGWGEFEYWQVPLIALAACFMVSLLARKTPKEGKSKRGRIAFTLCSAVFVMSALPYVQGHVRVRSLHQSFELHPFDNYWAHGVPFVMSKRYKHRIAFTSNWRTWFSYFFMGERLQNTILYVPVTHSGVTIYGGGDGQRRKQADYQAWHRRLLRRKIDTVITFREASLEQGWMQAHPQHFQRVAGDHGWGMFRVVGVVPEAR